MGPGRDPRSGIGRGTRFHVVSDHKAVYPRDDLRIVEVRPRERTRERTRKKRGLSGRVGPQRGIESSDEGRPGARTRERPESDEAEDAEIGLGADEALGVPIDDNVFGPHVGGCQLFGSCTRLRSFGVEEMLGLRSLEGLDLGQFQTFRPGVTRLDRLGAARVVEFARALGGASTGFRKSPGALDQSGSDVLGWLESDGRLGVCLHGFAETSRSGPGRTFQVDGTLRDHGVVTGRTPGRLEEAFREVDRRGPWSLRRGLSCPGCLERGDPVWPDFGWPDGEVPGCLRPEIDCRELRPIESIFFRAIPLLRVESESGFGRWNTRLDSEPRADRGSVGGIRA